MNRGAEADAGAGVSTDADAGAVVLRRARAVDARAAADVWLRSFAAALPTVVRPRSDSEVRAYFRHVVVERQETWVAEGPTARWPV